VQGNHRVLGSAVSLVGQRLDLRAICRDEGELSCDVESIDEDQSEDGTNAEKSLDFEPPKPVFGAKGGARLSGCRPAEGGHCSARSSASIIMHHDRFHRHDRQPV
jgi:hypothetical protein